MPFARPRALAAIVLLVLAAPAARAQSPDARARTLLRQMTLRERFWQAFMLPGTPEDTGQHYQDGVFGLQVPPADSARADAERINRVQRYFLERTHSGIPVVPFEEGVHGLRRPGATMFPQAIALAATWDTALMGRVATAIARETRSRGIRMLLSPVVNLATDVRWGRVEETYGEDPWLASLLARAYVAPLAAAGIIATPKHFVANVGAGGRDSWPIALDDRDLEEFHYPPFRAALAAGGLAVMASYNSLGGLPATQNRRLLTGVLRRAWGFRGVVISDASATSGSTVLHRTETSTAQAAAHAFQAGLDVVFQSSWPEHRPYLAAVERGTVPRAALDSAVARVLRTKAQIGLFDDPYGNPDSAAYWNGHASHLALAREAAAQAMVLLRNERGRLPLAGTLRSLAVIGTDAIETRLGGYSAPGAQPVSILDGLRERFGDRVAYAPGPGRFDQRWVTVPAGRLALKLEVFDHASFDGMPVETRADSVIDVRWTFNPPARGVATDWYAVRWTGVLTVGDDSVTQIGIEGTDGWRLWLDGALADNSHKQSFGTRLARVALAPHSRHDIRLEFVETTGPARLRLVWDAGIRPLDPALDSAVALARASEVAIVVAGIEEGEFRDRALLGLPGRQEELIRRVAATGTPTIVVLVGGSAITMPWLDDVDAVLLAWYPGEQGGRALADVLLGDRSPGGRLPITFPRAEGQLPLVYNHRPTGRGDDYLDLTGEPLFPFGFGLGYTDVAYEDLVITPDTIGARAGVRSATVRLRVRNTGRRVAEETVQLYVRDLVASVAPPVLALKGFTHVRLEPGDAREITFQLGFEELSMLDQSMRRVVEPGAFRVFVGASSRDIRLRGTLVVR